MPPNRRHPSSSLLVLVLGALLLPIAAFAQPATIEPPAVGDIPLDKLSALVGQPARNTTHLRKLGSQLQALVADYLEGRDVAAAVRGRGLQLSQSQDVSVDVYVQNTS